jgi:polar amino acid transport system substrate-binding protein
VPGIRSQACLLLLAAGLGLPVDASERTLRVAVLGKSPPMSFVDAAGKLAGFNVRVAHALCDAMSVRCELTATPLERVVDAVAAGEFDFAAVSLLDTAERRSRILFSKPYYRSSSIWFARPGVEPGAAGIRVAAVTRQRTIPLRPDAHLEHRVLHHSEFPALLTERKADAVLLPI